MATQTNGISPTSPRPMSLNFNTTYFNNISAQSYRHIGISEGTDKSTLQLMRLAANDNCASGNTAGLWDLSNDHIVDQRDGRTTDPMINLNPTSMAKYNEISGNGGSVTGSFMLIA